ncbi:MAG: glycosyl hydrolase, partial [Deltaproteobacteria bacterium]|nr:glycosyl hydrolase [Deltaproteobacteria bacterium]
QFAIFTNLLQDPSGFYRHAYNWPDQKDGVFWGRGNGWVAAAGYEYLRVRRNRGETDIDAKQAAGRLIDAALASQDLASGMWWTVLNRPGETYLETSATALFASAMARGYRYGYLNDGVLGAVYAAVEGIKTRIITDDEGRPVITDISGPTGPGSFKGYAAVKIVEDAPYGIGAVIMALVESSGLP